MIKNWIQFNEKFSQEDFKSTVSDVLKSERGGRQFFNKMDQIIKDNPDTIKEIMSGLEKDYIVCSGSFGDNLYDLWEKGELECRGILVFNGKIATKKRGINFYYPENFEIDNKEFVFVDDSLFSGKTVREIEKYLQEEHNSSIKLIKVGYDGSKEPNPKVKSLYRYYK